MDRVIILNEIFTELPTDLCVSFIESSYLRNMQNAPNNIKNTEMATENKYIAKKISVQNHSDLEIISKMVFELLETSEGAFCYDDLDMESTNIPKNMFRNWCQNAAWRGEIDFIKKNDKWWVGKKDKPL